MTISQYFSASGAGAERPEGDGQDFYATVIGAFEEVALLTTVQQVALDDVLRLVGQRLCELLEVSRCSVYLRRDDGRFQGQVGYCVGRSIDAGVSRLVAGVDNDRFTAEIVSTGSPVIVRNAAQDPRTVQRTMRRWGVLDMLGVPLVVDGDVIGIIYVDNQGAPREFTQHDIRLAQAFAGLCAIAVRQGWLYQQLGERASTIDHQRRVLGDTSVITGRVTSAVLDGADTESILRLIVELLGKPVVLYTPTLDITAWAAPDGLNLPKCPGLRREQFALPWIRKSLDALGNGSASTMLRATPETRCRRLLVRMVVDHECVGYLELCELGRGFSAVDSKALIQASMAIALKLLTDQRNTELQRQERGEFFADVLYGRRDLEALNRRAPAFGIDLDRRHVLLRLQYSDQLRAGKSTDGRAEATSLVTRHLEGTAAVVASTSVPGADVMLVELDDIGAAGIDGPLHRALTPACPALLAGGIRYVVISDPCRSLRELPAAAERLRETAGMLRDSAEPPGVVFGQQLHLLHLVGRRAGISGALRYSQELLGPLLDHDAANGGALVATLQAYIDSHAQIRRAAAMLAVHENTVRYRLSRVMEIAAIDPDRLDSLLNVSFALQVRRLFGGAERSPAS